MGDADCTYDFRRVGLFVDAMREGNEFAMGSRWRGSIEAGAMPKLHQYFGTPDDLDLTLYGSLLTSLRMRGSPDTRAHGHQLAVVGYASEMVLKSVHMDLRTIEAPVTFLKDREGASATTSARAGSRRSQRRGSTSRCSSTARISSPSSPAC
jgi:hypothetical protein